MATGTINSQTFSNSKNWGPSTPVTPVKDKAESFKLPPPSSSARSAAVARLASTLARLPAGTSRGAGAGSLFLP